MTKTNDADRDGIAITEDGRVVRSDRVRGFSGSGPIGGYPSEMCSEVIIRNGPVCDRVGDLCVTLGVEAVKHELYEVEPVPDACLCGVDVAAMAAACDPPMSCRYDQLHDRYYLDFSDG